MKADYVIGSRGSVRAGQRGEILAEVWSSPPLSSEVLALPSNTRIELERSWRVRWPDGAEEDLTEAQVVFVTVVP